MLLAGIDPCFSCSDRSVTVRRSGEEAVVIPWEQLSQFGK
jgi:hypothetical protein